MILKMRIIRDAATGKAGQFGAEADDFRDMRCRVQLSSLSNF
jgi:hypothetical protein